ncbi:alpha-galactosidase [Clostridium estertheticum]|uniref:glycoside hydrolase family 36 protein n=1 Tax=Clostridium estertheticum TaxID=238834 RepID=UPI001923F143|nr:glycoside hydrolase family 36 protein [Clostridium estertheticum]MBZ9689424.1 alpha-galactosidase [Clostridium estertheticum]
MKEIKTSKHIINVDGDEGLSLSLTSEESEKGLEIVKLRFSSLVPIHMPKITISWKHPIIDIHSYWYPTAFKNKAFHADWARGFFSKATSSAPVSCLYNMSGKNRLTCAFSDALNTVNMNMGIHEEDGTFECKIVLFTEPSKKVLTYEGELRLDTRNIPYYESLKDVSKWWETFKQYKPAFVPEFAKQPMYSTWYSFHQELIEGEVEKQCSIAKGLGCETIIVDDGWQTSDNNRGYAYCGDWKVAKERISNMREHVKRVHDIGLKYMLWYSVPFVGIHSEAWNRFKDNILSYDEHLKTGVLDPRYPEVREYLISIYENAVIEWDLDGLKLDFVDEFDLTVNGLDNYNEFMDFESVQEAVDCLLSTVIEKLRAIKPDFMIEFRQRYIGPCMRTYGNIFRVSDCPNDAITNRIGSMDIRLLCGNTAAHSDMIMWSTEDNVESAALQFINILFSVPQLSMRFENLTEEHFKMSRFWLNFWKKHRDVLIDGKLTPYYPELNYPLIASSTEKEYIVVVYSELVVHLSEETIRNVILVNGTLKGKVYLEIEDNFGERDIEVLNCCGELVRREKISLNKGLLSIDIPASGVAYLTS